IHFGLRFHLRVLRMDGRFRTRTCVSSFARDGSPNPYTHDADHSEIDERWTAVESGRTAAVLAVAQVNSTEMPATLLLRRDLVSVVDYRCTAGPNDRPFLERHDSFSVSYVRKGSFGYRVGGRSFELVAGSILVGHRGDEYMCTHEHVCGDECLSCHLAPALVQSIGGPASVWGAGSVPPLAELMVLGELAQAAAEERTVCGPDPAEVGMLLVGRFVD